MKYLLPSDARLQCVDCGSPVDTIESPTPYEGIVILGPCGHETTPAVLTASTLPSLLASASGGGVMGERRESWGWRDRRTGRLVSQSSTATREQAERELEGWWARDRRGKRPDLHDLMPHVEVFRIYPPDDTAGDLSDAGGRVEP